MSKTKKELMDAYKKSSKPARLVIIGRAGFTSEEEYFSYLETLDKPNFFKTKEEKEGKVAENGLDMVVCFDTTGSMSSYIGAVRQHVTHLIPEMFAANPDLRMKIVAFGDYCDMAVSSAMSGGVFGKAYQETQLTDNQDELIEFVKNAQNTSGGDGDEFYELVIKKVTEETTWRPNSKRAVLLIGDAKPHRQDYNYNGYYPNIDWKVEAQKSAEKGIKWDTLSCGYGALETFYRPLSAMTNGINLPFKTAADTQHILKGTASARGAMGTSGSESFRSFTASYSAAAKSGKTELVGAYKSLSTLLSADDKVVFDSLVTKTEKKK